MKTNLKSGFTLVELLVVIAIIGLLASVLVAYLPGVIESGRAVKCKANLKNLAQAIASKTINDTGNDDDAHMATAGSFEWRYLIMNSNDPNGRGLMYQSSSAWVSWSPNGQWPYPSKDVSRRDSMTPSTFFDKDRSGANSKAFYSITNGVIWSYLGKDASVYVCETHKKVLERQVSGRVYRSYVMNRFYGYDDRDEPPAYRRWVHMTDMTKSGTAPIRIMFAELPGQLGATIDTSSARADSVLDPNNNEYLGFNHKIGKKWVAHVAFSDGHVEGLVQPGLKPSTSDLKDLTTQLCNGTEIDATIRAKMQ